MLKHRSAAYLGRSLCAVQVSSRWAKNPNHQLSRVEQRTMRSLDDCRFLWRSAGCSLFDGPPHCGCPRSPRIGPPPTESKSSLPTTLARFRWAFHHAEASIVPLMCGSLRSRTRFWEPETSQVTSYPRPPRRSGEHSAQQPPDDTTTESASLQWSSTAPPAGGAPLEHWRVGLRSNIGHLFFPSIQLHLSPHTQRHQT